MRLLLGVALLGVAAAVPSSIQLKEATALVQRPRQEGHGRNWKLEAQLHGQSALWHSRRPSAEGCPFHTGSSELTRLESERRGALVPAQRHPLCCR